MIYSFSEEELRLAVINADRLIIASLPLDADIDHKFSTGFENKMKALIRLSREKKYNHNKIFNRRRFIAILAALIILLASIMSVAAVRETVFSFFTEVYEKFTHIFFEESQPTDIDPANQGDNEFMAQAPTYIPEGFELLIQDLDESIMMLYVNGDNSISYMQQKIENVSMDINTEGVELEDLLFNGLSAKFYSNQGMQNLIWYDDEYMYMLSSSLDRDTVFDIAESVEPIKTSEN